MKKSILYLITLSTTLACLLVSCRQQNNTQPTFDGPILNTQLKLNVSQTGIYKISLAELQKAGLAIETLDPSHLRLSYAEETTPFLIEADSLIFYGQEPANRYTTARTYLLTMGQSGVSMPKTAVSVPTVTATATAIPTTHHLEENITYAGQFRQEDDSDLWSWQTIGHRTQLPLTIDIPALTAGPATLELMLNGTTHDFKVENDHDLDIVINDQYIETIRWDGQTQHFAKLTLSDDVLQQGENIILLDNQVAGAARFDIMELNWLRLTHLAPAIAQNDQLTITNTEGTLQINGFTQQPTIIDITSPHQPRHLIEWTFTDKTAVVPTNSNQHLFAVGPKGYLTPEIQPVRQSNWHTADNQADLIILTTDELKPALDPLVAARIEQGLTVATIPVGDIYDAFGFGEPTPDSINAFLTHVHNKWQNPKPKYVFIVGDTSYDFRNYLNIDQNNLIPSPMVQVRFSGETVSDSRLTDVDNDGKPDFAIGRWPVRTVQEVKNLVERTLAYEQGDVAKQTIFAADGTESVFSNTAQRIVEKAELPEANVTLFGSADAAKVTEAWNKGSWLTAYIGHGAVGQWGKEDVLTVETVANLNSTTPPIVLQLTCLTGLFSHPELNSLSEAMLTQESGPVLIVAATSLTYSQEQEPFAITLLNNLQDPTIQRIGDAFQDAKRTLNIDGIGSQEISDTFVLLGDPSTLIMRPTN